MKVEVQDISAVEKKLVVEVPADAVDEALEVEFRQLSRNVKMRGFRPGKVPKSLVRRMYRTQAHQQAASTLIQQHIVGALEQASIEPLDMPDIDREELAEGTPFIFSLTMQVRPEIVLGDLSSIQVGPVDSSVPDEALQAELEKLRMERAELEAVEDRGADIGDVVTIDYLGTLVGETEPFPGGAGTDHAVEIGAGSLVSGFEDQLAGARPGEERTVEVTFPEDYAERLAGKAATFAVTVKGVQRRILAELDDDFAVDVGFEDLGALRASIYDRLAGAKRREEEGRQREELIRGLIALHPLELPPGLVESARNRLTSQLALHLAMGGLPRESVAHAVEMQREHITERARELAHRDLLLDTLARREGLSVEADEVEARIDEIAAATGQPRPKVKARMTDERLEGLRVELLHDKVLDWLIDRGTGAVPWEAESSAEEPPAAAEATESAAADAPDEAPASTEGDTLSADSDDEERAHDDEADAG